MFLPQILCKRRPTAAEGDRRGQSEALQGKRSHPPATISARHHEASSIVPFSRPAEASPEKIYLLVTAVALSLAEMTNPTPGRRGRELLCNWLRRTSPVGLLAAKLHKTHPSLRRGGGLFRMICRLRFLKLMPE